MAKLNVAVHMYTHDTILLTQDTKPGTARDWKKYAEGFDDIVEVRQRDGDQVIKIGLGAEDDVFPGKSRRIN
jgi:hypothetical protein